MEKELSIEESLQELAKIIDRMEQGEQSLEEALADYEAGIGLVRSCSQKIDLVEKKIQVLAAEDEME